MKKYILNITLFLATCLLGVSCSENFMELDKGNDVLTLTVPSTEITLEEVNHNSDGVALTWTSGTNNGTGNKISYNLELSIDQDVDGAEPTITEPLILELGNDVYSWNKTVEEINTFLHEKFDVEYGKQVALRAKIVANVANHEEMIQTAETVMNITTYEPVTSTLYIIGTASPGGWSLDNAPEMVREDNGFFTWIGKLNAGTFKMVLSRSEFMPSYNRDETDTTNSKLVLRTSDDEPDEQFTIAEDGFYKVTIDLFNMSLSVAESTGETWRFEHLYFVGMFSNWTSMPMTRDALQMNLWHYGAEFNWNDSGSDFKFGTANGSWDNMLVATQPEAPITSTDVAYNSGNDYKWQLTKDQCNKAYKIFLYVAKGKEKMVMKQFTPYTGIWLVGDATPNGWDLGNATPMQATASPYIFTWTGRLNSGEIKLSCDKKSDWNGAWFMAYNNGKAPTGEEESTLFIDKSDPEFAENYPDVNIGDTDSKWKISDPGNYTITINQLTEKITFVKN